MSSEPTPTLEQIATTIEQAGLREPLVIVVDLLRNVDVIACQSALFLYPFLSGTRWHHYAHALSQNGSWHELHRLLTRQ